MQVARAILQKHTEVILPRLRLDEETVDSDGDTDYDDPALRPQEAGVVNPPPERAPIHAGSPMALHRNPRGGGDVGMPAAPRAEEQEPAAADQPGGGTGPSGSKPQLGLTVLLATHYESASKLCTRRRAPILTGIDAQACVRWARGSTDQEARDLLASLLGPRQDIPSGVGGSSRRRRHATQVPGRA